VSTAARVVHAPPGSKDTRATVLARAIGRTCLEHNIRLSRHMGLIMCNASSTPRWPRRRESSRARECTRCARVTLPRLTSPRRRSVWRRFFVPESKDTRPAETRARKHLVQHTRTLSNIRRYFLVRNLIHAF